MHSGPQHYLVLGFNFFIFGYKHKVNIFLEYHGLFPRPNWESPTTSPASECAPPELKGGGGERVRESQFGRLEKRPSTLSTLWLAVWMRCG
jgi:hypothetical protein